jgi:hypothetical protein
MNKNELTYGAEYAVNIGGRRYPHYRRAVYLGDAPWTFGGSTQASLHSIRFDAPGLEAKTEGSDYVFYKRGEGYAPLRLRNSYVRQYKDEAWVIAPDETRSWRAQSPYGRGNAKRALFALLGDDGKVTRWDVVAYGVRIERTWEEQQTLNAKAATERAKVEAERQLTRDYSHAIIARAIEIIDERGWTTKAGEDPVWWILGVERGTAMREESWYTVGPAVVRAKALLLGAGELDSSDIID